MKMVALIIDDDSLNTEVLVHLLKREAMDTLSLKYPDQLPEFVKSVRDVEVIFLDIEFPDANGFDIIKELRNSPNLQDIPIVAYSVHISEIDRARRSTEFPRQLQRILNREAVWEA